MRVRLHLCAVAFVASPAGGQQLALSFEAADARLAHVSLGLAAADHVVNAARETQAALATLRRPVITASAQFVEYQKTLALDVSATKQDVLNRTESYVGSVPGSLPASFQDVASQVTGQISQALPGLFALTPDSLSYRQRSDAFRPNLQATLPLYTGGAIAALQRGGAAGVSLARGQAAQARTAERMNLIRLYFGQLAAQSLEDSARRSRDALAKVSDDTRKLEREGVAPHARMLEAEVARDQAERIYQRAMLANDSAREDLARLLDVPAVSPTTPLFVQSQPLPPAASFLGGEGDIPEARQADAGRDLAHAGVDLARSRFRPQAFAFGEYNLSRGQALPTDPDWIVGVGARMTLLSNVDRRHSLAAAKETEAAADARSREARRNAATGTLRTWALVETARRSFLLLDSSISAAEENLRVQRLSYAEGEANLTAVLGAEAALSSARSQRAAAAYEYDLSLAALLAASGWLDSFADQIARADIRLAPAAAQ